MTSNELILSDYLSLNKSACLCKAQMISCQTVYVVSTVND